MVAERGVRGPDGMWRIPDSILLQESGLNLMKELNDNKITTLPQIVKYSTKKNAQMRCMATRTLIHRKIEMVNGVKHEKLELGDYRWQTYDDVYEKVRKFAAGILGMGLKYQSKIAILAETRADWFTAAVGCLEAGLTVVTLYTNLNDSALTHGISETEVDTVITSYELLPRLCVFLPQLTKVKRVIVLEDQLEGMGKPTELNSSVSFISFSALLKKADLSILDQHTGPTEDDVAIIMYTSGSTGNPKGVLLTHKNIVAAIYGYATKMVVKAGDCFLAFLPLPHVMELSTEIALIALGVSIAYSSLHTMTSNSLKIMKGTLGDAKVIQPTYINAVPLILDRIIKGVFDNVEKQGKLKSKVFSEALKYKQSYPTGITASILDQLIFSKVKAELGGKLRLIITGGAPLSRRTESLISAMFGCQVICGYGSTETAACITCMDADDTVPCSSGVPNYGVSILLEDWDEGGYKVADKPRPRGEILVGGDIVSAGYFNLPKETEESFVERKGVRYFKTGDIGEFDGRGVLHIIDRKKDLVKLQHGEYVSLGNVESTLKTHSLLENICIFADSKECYIVAVALPVPELLRKIARSLSKPDSTAHEDLCRDKDVVRVVVQQLADFGKKQKLNKSEIPRKVHLTSDLWSPETGLVTAAFKLRRRQLCNRYACQVAALYAAN